MRWNLFLYALNLRMTYFGQRASSRPEASRGLESAFVLGIFIFCSWNLLPKCEQHGYPAGWWKIHSLVVPATSTNSQPTSGSTAASLTISWTQIHDWTKLSHQLILALTANKENCYEINIYCLKQLSVGKFVLQQKLTS